MEEDIRAKEYKIKKTNFEPELNYFLHVIFYASNGVYSEASKLKTKDFFEVIEWYYLMRVKNMV